MAAYKGKIEELGIVWEWAKDVLTPDDISNKFLLAEMIEKDCQALRNIRDNVQLLGRI